MGELVRYGKISLGGDAQNAQTHGELVKRGQNDAIIKILITTIVEKLHDDDEDVRAAGVHALARFGTNGKTVHSTRMSAC